MSKVTLDPINNTYGSTAKINANSITVANELNSKVLYRDNPSGEPNQMENNLDMNSNRVHNLLDAITSQEPATYSQLLAAGSGLVFVPESNHQFFDTVAIAKLGNFTIGYKITTAENTVGNGGGADYIVEALGSPDGYRDHATSDGNFQLTLQIGTEVDVRKFGATGGADDYASLQSALDEGGDIVFDPIHNIGTAFTVSTDFSVRVRGGGMCTFTPAFTGRIFKSTCSNVEITGLKLSGENTLLYQSGNFETINLHNNDYTGGDDSVTSYLLESASSISGDTLNISDNTTAKCTLWFGDGTSVAMVHIYRNTASQPTRFYVRNLKQSGIARSGQINFSDNKLEDLNGDLTDKTTDARVLQVETEVITHVHRNVLNGAESTDAAAFIYLKHGSLNVSGNLIKNVKGTSNTSLIDNKGSTVTATPDEYVWSVTDNEFDQRGTTYAQSPEAAIRINEARNVTVSSNKFKGLKCYATRFYNSEDLGYPAENVSFINNEIYAHEHPVVCQVFQNIKNTKVSGNIVHKITNPNTLDINGRTRCRVVDIYQSFHNGYNMENVVVTNNVMLDTPSDASVATVYKHATIVPTTKNITGVTQTNPIVVTSVAHGFTDFNIIDISGIVGMTELNGNTYMTSNEDADTFELIDVDSRDSIDGTGFTAYVSDGTFFKEGDITGISIVGNEMKTGTSGALVRFTVAPFSQVDLINNIGPNGMTETLGGTPTMRSAGNVLT